MSPRNPDMKLWISSFPARESQFLSHVERAGKAYRYLGYVRSFRVTYAFKKSIIADADGSIGMPRRGLTSRGTYTPGPDD